MKLSIVIPVFNEKYLIEKTIKEVFSANTLNFDKEIIIVNDGSNDETEKILEKLKEKYNFLLINHPKNLGKGAAIKTALEYVSGDFVLIQDADLEYGPEDYPILLNAIDSEFLVVYGFRKNYQRKRGSFLFFLGGKFLNCFFNFLFKTKLKDINTGCKLFKTDILKNINLQEKNFNFCVEVTAKIIKKGYKIREVPINYYPRKFFQGKKIKIIDGLFFLFAIIKYYFR